MSLVIILLRADTETGIVCSAANLAAFTALPDNRRGLSDMFLMSLRSCMAIIGSRIVLNVRRTVSFHGYRLHLEAQAQTFLQNQIVKEAYRFVSTVTLQSTVYCLTDIHMMSSVADIEMKILSSSLG